LTAKKTQDPVTNHSASLLRTPRRRCQCPHAKRHDQIIFFYRFLFNDFKSFGGVNNSLPPFSRTVGRARNAPKGGALYQPHRRISTQCDSTAKRLLNRKENSAPTFRRCLGVRLRCRTLSTSRRGNINPLPFRQAALSEEKRACHGLNLLLRIGSPVSNCCSHGTFLHFSLQSSLLNSCGYHRDPH